MSPPNPPPAPEQPLNVRALNLVKTLQFGWFVGHFTLLAATLRYTVSIFKFTSNSTTATICYRLAFMSAVATYGIVVFKAYRGKIRNGQMPMGQQGVMKILGDENVQYLLMALVWLYSKAVFFALFPFAVYSTFHFLTYLRGNLIPVFLPYSAGTPPPAISETLSKFIKNNYDASMYLVANLEILLWVRVCLYCLVFQNSWILLIMYTFFLKARYAQSVFVRDALKAIELKGDALIVDARVPDGGRSAWNIGKVLVKRFGEVTDFGKMTGGATPVKKE